MIIELTDAQWLNDHDEVSFAELTALSGMSTELLNELIEHGALVPINFSTDNGPDLGRWRFTTRCVATVRKLNRLSEDFDLDANSLSVVFALLDRLHDLEARLHELQMQRPR
jgi:hypothetical protein